MATNIRKYIVPIITLILASALIVFAILRIKYPLLNEEEFNDI
jgi:hypothetical protein